MTTHMVTHVSSYIETSPAERLLAVRLQSEDRVTLNGM